MALLYIRMALRFLEKNPTLPNEKSIAILSYLEHLKTQSFVSSETDLYKRAAALLHEKQTEAEWVLV